MILNHVKLGHTVNFIKYLARIVPLIFLMKIFNLKLNDVSSLKFTENYRTAGKQFKGNSLQKYLPMIISTSNSSLLFNVKILRPHFKDFKSS